MIHGVPYYPGKKKSLPQIVYQVVKGGKVVCTHISRWDAIECDNRHNLALMEVEDDPEWTYGWH